MMNNKSKHHPYMLIGELALLGLIVQHIVGKTYIRHMPSSDDWLFGNFIDGLLRPSFILLMIAAGVVARNEYQKGLDSFYRKMVAVILPFGVSLAIYILAYGRYDTRVFDFKVAGILETAGYSLYWVPLLITYLVVTPFVMWVSSQRYGKRILTVFMCCWAIFVVIIPSVYFGRLLLHSISPGSTEGLNAFLENLNAGFCKRVLNVVNESMGFKLWGFFLLGLLYIDNWGKVIESNAALKIFTIIFVLPALYAITLCIPFAEQRLKMDPYDHGARDYILCHMAVLGTVMYMILDMILASSKKIRDWLTRHSKLCDCVVVGMYVIHATLIEMLAGWIPPIPILGLLVKTLVLLFLSFLFGYALYYIFYGDKRWLSGAWRGKNLRGNYMEDQYENF